MPRRFKALLLCALVSIVGCNDKFESLSSPPAARATLIGTLQSFDTPAEAKAKIDPKFLPWKTISEPRVAFPDDKRPRFEFLEVRVEGYVHLGQRCNLELVFFNDRLIEVRLLPEDLSSLLAALDDKARIDLLSNKEVRVGVHVEAKRWTTIKGETWVGFQDIRLQEEVHDWIARFS
jgi:hypothetical protein